MPSAHDNQWIRSGTAFWVEPDPKKGCTYGEGWRLGRLTFCIFPKTEGRFDQRPSPYSGFYPFFENPGRFDGS